MITREERSWILYDAANSVYAVVVLTALFPLFFKNYCAAGLADHISTSYLAYCNSIISLIVALTAPFLGIWADQVRLRKELFVFFILTGVCATACFFLLYSGDYVAALFIYGCSFLGFALANLFYDAFLPDITSVERLDTLSSHGYAWGYLGGAVGFSLCFIFILFHTEFGLSERVFAVKFSFLLTALWWLIFSLPAMIFLKQEMVKQDNYLSICCKDLVCDKPLKGFSFRLKDFLHTIKQNRNLRFFLLAYFFYIDGVGTIFKLAAAYGADLGIEAERLIAVIFMVQIVGFPFALIYGRLAKRFSPSVMIFTAIGVYIFVALLGFTLSFIASRDVRVVLFWLLSFLVATSQGGIQALSRSLYARLIPAGRSTEYFGFYNIFGRFAAVMGPALLGVITYLSGNSAYGVLSIALFFILGACFLKKVQII